MSQSRAALVIGFALLALPGRIAAQKDSLGDPPFKLPDSVELKGF